MAVTIQKFERQWQAQVADLVLGIQNNEFNLGITLAMQIDLQDTEKFYNKGGFWVAIVNEKVVGSIGLQELTEGVGILRKMFVDKNFRGKELSIAQKLFDVLLEEAQKMKLKQLYLDTPPIAYAAHRLYERNGFVETTRDKLPNTYKFVEMPLKFYCLEI
jgi:N-acetylglutamate synthase-like GNAT family acetyltransferase